MVIICSQKISFINLAIVASGQTDRLAPMSMKVNISVIFHCHRLRMPVVTNAIFFVLRAVRSDDVPHGNL